MTAPDAFAASRALEVRVIGAEAAGIFWLGAELAILLGVLAARAYLAGPLDAPMFPPRQRQRFLWAFGGLAAMAVLVLGRHWFLQAPHRTPAMLDWARHGEPERVAQAYHAFLSAHHAVWVSFVAGWVILECLIVWNGLLLYRALMRKLTA